VVPKIVDPKRGCFLIWWHPKSAPMAIATRPSMTQYDQVRPVDRPVERFSVGLPHTYDQWSGFGKIYNHRDIFPY
jgi:hypothetical protein